MHEDKVKQIIKEKNEKLEYDATRSASRIIDQIADCQNEIEVAQKKIIELRKELHDLEIVQMNEKQILGKE
jgi:hypothetical protein